MGLLKQLPYFLLHPNQLRSIIQWKLWHDPVHSRDKTKECESLRQCFYYLDMTSRSFSSVIQELHPELLVPVAIFYLVLRGLDTIEDDMTIPIARKEPLLRHFDEILQLDEWTFTESGPNEKDRELLVHFDCVLKEYRKLKPQYRKIITKYTIVMGNGMADYCNNAEHNINGVQSTKDYEKYCHYVAGVVGAGLTDLFVDAELANPALLKRPELAESMGQFLQKTNIIRDLREDWDDKRRFYPKEIWTKHVDNFDELFVPTNINKALATTSEMVLNALHNVPDCLFYMAGIKDQSVFNFVAIPQVMAIATLEVVFMNPKITTSVIKITKGDACKLMMEASQNLRTVCDIFLRYTRRIHKKNSPKNPSFLEISIACGKIEQFIESIFPSQDPKTLSLLHGADGPIATIEDQEKLRQQKEDKKDVFLLLLSVVGTLFVVSGLMIGAAYLLGARFDIAFSELTKGNFRPSQSLGTDPTPSVIAQHDIHEEL